MIVSDTETIISARPESSWGQQYVFYQFSRSIFNREHIKLFNILCKKVIVHYSWMITSVFE